MDKGEKATPNNLFRAIFRPGLQPRSLDKHFVYFTKLIRSVELEKVFLLVSSSIRVKAEINHWEERNHFCFDLFGNLPFLHFCFIGLWVGRENRVLARRPHVN